MHVQKIDSTKTMRDFEIDWKKLGNLGEYKINLNPNLPGKIILRGFFDYGMPDCTSSVFGKYKVIKHYDKDFLANKKQFAIRDLQNHELIWPESSGSVLTNYDAKIYLFDTSGFIRRWKGFPLSLGIEVEPINSGDKIYSEIKIKTKADYGNYYNLPILKQREVESKLLRMVRDVVLNLKINTSYSSVSVQNTELEKNTSSNPLYQSIEDRLDRFHCQYSKETDWISKQTSDIPSSSPILFF